MAVCGVDEAGRGPLAGPVAAAACILPRGIVIEGLNDSKKLSERKRESLEIEIKERALAFCVASASVEEIDRLNILNATFLAMRRAVNGLRGKPDFALVDGHIYPPFEIEGICVKGGDSKCPSIAASSVLAKVWRDGYCRMIDEKYPEYGFAKHKGYGTKEHIEAIKKYGITPDHRPLFVRKFIDGK